MNLNHVERALDSAWRMLEARAALQQILGDKYPAVVKGWVDAIREKCRETGKGPVEICCLMAEEITDQWLLLAVLAATLEIVEEKARISH